LNNFVVGAPYECFLGDLRLSWQFTADVIPIILKLYKFSKSLTAVYSLYKHYVGHCPLSGEYLKYMMLWKLGPFPSGIGGGGDHSDGPN
jgi:hypothetical protein